MHTAEGKYIRYQFNEFGADLEKTELNIPKPEGTEVLVKMDFCGVCHSDVHVHEGFFRLGGDKKLTMQERGLQLPVTLGHEVVGTVIANGDEASASVGQQVLVYPWVGCGQCSVCHRGEENLCAKQATIGIVNPGGYSQYVLVPDSKYLFDIGQINPAHAPLLACSGLTTFSAVKKMGKVYDDETVVVIGCGGLGQLAIRILSLFGVKNIIAVDISQEKREASQLSGATASIDPTVEDGAEQIKTLSDQRCIAVLDFVGSSETCDLGLAVLQRGGRLVLVGLHGGEMRYPLPLLITRSINVIATYTGSLTDQKELLEFANQHDLFSLDVKVEPLSNADDALKRLAKGEIVGRVVLENN